MRITLNGEARNFEAPLTVSSLLQQLGLNQRKIAVERNREMVPHSTFQQTDIIDGDTLEIVHFIGGGNSQPFPSLTNKIDKKEGDEDGTSDD